MHGADDRVTHPRGTELLHERAASADKTIVLWKGMKHEPLNSPGRDEVIARMLSWLDERIPAP
jgi:acylglycerol lipase